MHLVDKMRWAAVKDFPNYEISDNGDLRVIKTHKLIKKQFDRRFNYVRVQYQLYNNDLMKTRRAHQLVGDAFITKPESNEKLMIKHIDRNPLNNHFSNLEWVPALRWIKSLRVGREISDF